MNCQVCGNQLVPGSGFCGSCGAPVSAPTAADAPTVPAPLPPTSGGSGPPPPGSPYPAGWSEAPAPSGSNKGLLWGLVAAVVVIVGGVGAFLAFGGDDDDEPAAAPTSTTSEPEATTTSTTEVEDLLSLADWADEADDICAVAEEEIGETGIPADEDELIEILEEVIELASGLHEDLEALGPPDDKADEAEALLALFEDRIELLEDILAAAEDGDLDLWDEFADEGYPDVDEAEELADDLGLRICAVVGDDGPVPTTTTSTTQPQTPPGDPFTYGDDPALDALWDACDAGDPDACDELWTASTYGTEYYDFGFSCGYRVPEGEVDICSNVMGGQGDIIDAFTYGDDPYLDSLWTACSGGDPTACDDLYFDSPIGSVYEEFGFSCGYRVPEGDVEVCSDIM